MAVIFIYVRFINGMNQIVNISTPEADFGQIKPFLYSNYTLLENGM